MKELRIIAAQDGDLDRFIDLMEELADWLEARGINQWRPGTFRLSTDFYAASIKQGEVQLAFLDEVLVGALRLLLREPIVWPDVIGDDAVYVYNLAVRRAWARQQFGRRMLEWTAGRAASLGRSYVRLDCMSDNGFLREYYRRAGFAERGEIDARFPEPIGTLRLLRFEKQITGLPNKRLQPTAPARS